MTKQTKFKICLKDATTYEFYADNEEEAKEFALEWWSERLPKMLISCKEQEKEE